MASFAGGLQELQAIAESFLEGRIEQEVKPWTAVANRWHGVLCESTMTQVVESGPRPTNAEAFFVDPAWPLVVEHGIDWLISAAMIMQVHRTATLRVITSR